MKKTVLMFSSLLATSSFVSSVSAAEKSEEKVKPYSINAIEKALPNVPEQLKNLNLKVEVKEETGKDYLTDADISKVDPDNLFNIYNEFKDEFESNSYTEDELNKMVADRIKEALQEASSTFSTRDYEVPLWDDLNAAEKALGKKHPIELVKYGAAAKTAAAEASKYYSDKQLVQLNGDAFRHSFWNAILVPIFGAYSPSHGVDRAKVWTDAHESTSSGIDKEMDLINNEIGRQYGYMNYTKTNSQMSSDLRKMVSQGIMVRIVNGNLTATNGTTGK